MESETSGLANRKTANVKREIQLQAASRKPQAISYKRIQPKV